MHLEKFEAVHYDLEELTISELRWLKNVVQNPLYGQSPDEEDEIDRQMRDKYWNAIHQQLK